MKNKMILLFCSLFVPVMAVLSSAESKVLNYNVKYSTIIDSKVVDAATVESFVKANEEIKKLLDTSDLCDVSCYAVPDREGVRMVWIVMSGGVLSEEVRNKAEAIVFKEILGIEFVKR